MMMCKRKTFYGHFIDWMRS